MKDGLKTAPGVKSGRCLINYPSEKSVETPGYSHFVPSGHQEAHSHQILVALTVPGRSDFRVVERAEISFRVTPLAYCCARGRAHSAKHIPFRGGEGEDAGFASCRVHPAVVLQRTAGTEKTASSPRPSPPGEEREKTRTGSLASWASTRRLDCPRFADSDETRILAGRSLTVAALMK